MIYFIQNTTNKAIKIGRSNDPDRRLAALQTASPDRLLLIAVLPGDISEEMGLHDRFQRYRLQGEWFSSNKPDSGILEFVAGINMGQRMIAPVAEDPDLIRLVRYAVRHSVELDCRVPRDGINVCLYKVIRSSTCDKGREFEQWLNRHENSSFATPLYACLDYVKNFFFWDQCKTNNNNEYTYKGMKFLSRISAQWAVYFDAIGLGWEYRKQGFDLGENKPYYPDFWLPYANYWGEVNQKPFSSQETEKMARLADSSGHPVVLLAGIPAPTAYQAICPHSKDSIDVILEPYKHYDEHRFFSNTGYDQGAQICKEYYSRIYDAVETSRNYMFEFSEQD